MAHQRDYAYLLGVYLGDGCISAGRRSFVLRVACDVRYPDIIAECAAAMVSVRGNGGQVWQAAAVGCFQVGLGWRHWPCAFPQHGPGRKHARELVLDDWQQAAVARYPDAFVRGLMQTNGNRCNNRVRVRRRTYEYPRYFFSNESTEIRAWLCQGLDLLGVAWRANRHNSISVARRDAVALLDRYVGPKS